MMYLLLLITITVICLLFLPKFHLVDSEYYYEEPKYETILSQEEAYKFKDVDFAIPVPDDTLVIKLDLRMNKLEEFKSLGDTFEIGKVKVPDGKEYYPIDEVIYKSDVDEPTIRRCVAKQVLVNRDKLSKEDRHYAEDFLTTVIIHLLLPNKEDETN